MTKTKYNSICNNCYWCDQCGEDSIKNCKFNDDISKLGLLNIDDEELLFNSPIDNYIEHKREVYRYEWSGYITYFYHEAGKDSYDS